MTTELRKPSSSDTIPTDPFLKDVVTDATSSWPGVDNVTREVFHAPEGCLVIPYSTHEPWNNPEDLVSYETHQTFKELVDVYLLPLCFLVSAPTNVVSMVVFWKHGIKERINLCLFCLSLSDLIVVVFHFEMKADRVYAAVSKTVYTGVVLKHTVNNMVHSLAGFVYVSGFLSTLIAFERCLCVCSPLKAQRFIRTATTAVVIAVGHVLILAGHGVIAARFKVVCMFDPLTGQSTDALYSSQFYINNRVLVDVLAGVFYGILLPGIFVAGVTVSTVATVINLRRMVEWREKSSSSSSSSSSASIAGGAAATRDVTLTRMLIGTSCVFVVCTAPFFLFHTTLPFVPELSLSGKYRNTYYMLLTMQQMCVYVNSSVNFFVYYLFGTKFRLTVRGMLCECRNRTKSGGKNKAGVELNTVVSSVGACD